jgi:hypothetical protein
MFQQVVGGTGARLSPRRRELRHHHLQLAARRGARDPLLDLGVTGFGLISDNRPE